MDNLLATLEARNPPLGRIRSYRLEAGTDLLWGRAGKYSELAKVST
jgi:hypothetical protein